MPSDTLTPSSLKCNYAVNPQGIDTPVPTVSWELKGSGRGRRQTAYQIIVASSKGLLDQEKSDIWDSGRIESSQSLHVPYSGIRLESRQRCWWKVRAWDEQGRAGVWSETACWEMGLLEDKDWSAQWIASPKQTPLPNLSSPPAPYFRRTFTLAKPVMSARAYVCGLGYYELYLNGRKVGEHVLDPLFTKYDTRSLYVTHDITDLVAGGGNVVGVVLGSGWYNAHTKEVWNFHEAPWRHIPKLIAQLHFLHEDGTETVVSSDASWKTGTGPIMFDGLRNGEFYDARREITGWCGLGFDDSAWDRAFVAPAPGGVLSAQTLPIKVMQTLQPIGITEPKPGVFVVDMGQNMTGWVQLRVQGQAGTEVTLRYAEKLGEDGDIDQGNIGMFVKTGQVQTDKYTLKGGGEEVWEPRFTYHGFRWVQVTGFPGQPTVDSLQGKVVHSAFESAGQFKCSNELLNKIQECTRWSYIGNFTGIPTDCPHREKNGWTGDALLAAETGLFNYASAAAYVKWLDDFADVQRKTGQLPGIVPTGGWGFNWGSGPAWDSAYTHIPWYLYLYCGDLTVLRRHYAGMKRYVDFMTTMATGHILSFGLGDWCPPGGSEAHKAPAALTSTGYYYANCRILSRVAMRLGRKGDARKYQSLARKIRKAFHKEFYDPATGGYAGNGQTSMGCALFQGLVDGKDRPRVEKALLDAIEKNRGLLDYGILGAKYVPNALTAAGRTDVALAMATRTEFPSYGHWLGQGATTLWEAWDGNSSRNHIMFGDISAWMFKALAGINPDPDQPGFRRIVIHPHPVDGLDWARAEHRCLYGIIRSAWEKKAGLFMLEVTVPINTTAEVWLPSPDPALVKADGKPVADMAAIKFLRAEAGASVFETGSGDYRFEVMQR
ncbi:MAG: glycoside hydrolase family 78 protein [Verrucomicrobia bacterium]|nr:glycoside hydrolase family 78 protein [Verrucomicrobiota bacterium]MCG2680848.1 glycoside hydrolase family 78 protein [Kiritimatiellia bacterium]MBU4246858.1 glycoside hydrolase family 78 protein [Verrucomicrobiota bacterium]MBU4290396.1 glycoside hydrolase family 78 protein [Verrucomicrobiota bacterium]MBU4430247.1 glycoside hydrolase family 78 protein [Verrucomicrobiota bacterium]